MNERQPSLLILPTRTRNHGGKANFRAFIPRSDAEKPGLLECEIPLAVQGEAALGAFAVDRLCYYECKADTDMYPEVFESTIHPSTKLAIVRGVERSWGTKKVEEEALYKVLDPVFSLEETALPPEISAAFARADMKSVGVGRRAVYRWLVTGNSEQKAAIDESLAPWLRRVGANAGLEPSKCINESPGRLQILPIQVREKSGQLWAHANLMADGTLGLLEVDVKRQKSKSIGAQIREAMKDYNYDVVNSAILDIFASRREPQRLFAIMRGITQPPLAKSDLREVPLRQILNSLSRLEAPGIFPEVNTAIAKASMMLGKRSVAGWAQWGPIHRSDDKKIIHALNPWLTRIYCGRIKANA